MTEQTGLEYVRTADESGIMPPADSSTGPLPRLWSESVINSSIGRGAIANWPYSSTHKITYPTVAAVFTSKTNPAEVCACEAELGCCILWLVNCVHLLCGVVYLCLLCLV